jgi:hypothetical protein
MIKKRRSRKGVPTSRTPVSSMTKEREKIQKQIERTYDKLRNKHPEIRGKVVDFVQQSVSDGIVYVFGAQRTVRLSAHDGRTAKAGHACES